jgi:hypothetical protein
MPDEHIAHNAHAAHDAVATDNLERGRYINTPVSTHPDHVIELELNALLGAPAPADWHDPAMLVLRRSKLERAACNAAEAMIELLVRLRDERARSVHMDEGGCVLACVDVMFALHRALTAYTHNTLLYDGEAVARDAITQVHGRGVAALTMFTLDELRALITREMQALPWPDAE